MAIVLHDRIEMAAEDPAAIEPPGSSVFDVFVDKPLFELCSHLEEELPSFIAKMREQGHAQGQQGQQGQQVQAASGPGADESDGRTCAPAPAATPAAQA